MNVSYPLYVKLIRMYNAILSNGCFNFEITNKCQLRCKHCYFFRNNAEQKELSLHEITKMAEEFKNNGGRHAWITGGEPTCRMDAVEKVLEIIPNVKIVTNGYKKISPKYKPLIFFSVEGGREDNIQIRGKDTWNLLFENYKDDKRVLSVMTINSKNYKSMKDFVDLSKKANIRGSVFSIYSPSLLNKNDELVLSFQQKNEVFLSFKKLKKENGSFIKMGLNLMKSMLGGVRYERCIWKNLKVLRFDGTYKFCPMFDKKEEADCNNCGCVSAAIKIRPLLNVPYGLDLI